MSLGRLQAADSGDRWDKHLQGLSSLFSLSRHQLLSPTGRWDHMDMIQHSLCLKPHPDPICKAGSGGVPGRSQPSCRWSVRTPASDRNRAPLGMLSLLGNGMLRTRKNGLLWVFLVGCPRTISDTSQGWRPLRNCADQRSAIKGSLKKLGECTDREKEGRTSEMKHLCEEG